MMNRDMQGYTEEKPMEPSDPVREPDDTGVVKKIRRTFSWIGLSYVVFIAVSSVSQMAAALILSRYFGNLDENITMLLVILGMYPVSVPVFALMMKRIDLQRGIGREQWNFGKKCGFFVFSMGALYVGNIVGIILMSLAGMITGKPMVNDVQELILKMKPWSIFVSAVVTAPIVEELVFRKILLDRIAAYGHGTAIIVSGFLFGVAHGNFYQFFYAFALGTIFAYIYLHTGRIWYTMVFHMIINFYGGIVPIGIMKITEKNFVLGGLLTYGNIMFMAAFVISAAVLLFCFWESLSFDRGEITLPFGKKIVSVIFNPGMILFVAAAIVLFFV